jgi:hypothetical protein
MPTPDYFEDWFQLFVQLFQLDDEMQQRWREYYKRSYIETIKVSEEYL